MGIGFGCEHEDGLERNSPMASLQRYEVRVVVPESDKPHYFHKFRMKNKYRAQCILDKTLKVFHFWANDPAQAIDKAKKHGRPISARKVNRDKIMSDIEHIKLDQKQYGEDNIFVNAIAMDELIWNKKAKRSERIEDQKKDRQGT